MASLRARLTVAMVGLAAIGLLLVGAITYFEQRSFLYDRYLENYQTDEPKPATVKLML